MHEADVFEKLSEAIKNGRPAALVSVLESAGSTPGKQGSVMTVMKDGKTYGTVGGGSLEYTVITQALKCIEENKDGEYSYDLDTGGDVGMVCGGALRVYIKSFRSGDRLVIAGGGHIGAQLCRLALTQNFAVTVIDERSEFAAQARFPDADVICKNAAEALKELNTDENTYIAICTHSHECDEEALRTALTLPSAYTGMIGSRKKVQGITERMLADGISQADIDRAYAPMGLDIASVKPEEIALSIISEIMLVKNSGTLRHMRDKSKA